MRSKKISQYGRLQSILPYRIVSSLPFALLTHWVFQSMLYVDPTERWFKISIDITLTTVFTIIFNAIINQLGLAFLLAFLISHTINFLCNGQLWCVLKNFGISRIEYLNFVNHVNNIASRARREPSLAHMYIYGSITLKNWTQESDFDARIIRKPGFLNGLRACWFLLKERTRALLLCFPIDIYVLDNFKSLQKMNPREKGIDLLEENLKCETIF
jgi:hypothetical protein